MPEGRLIALEGNGPELRVMAKRLAKSQGGGVSAWDASSIFFEMRRPDREVPAPSPRTLVLLYAADLAFRLRWEIRPALAEDQVVIAAPYVESAIAFGRAAGLPHRWLANLFQFAAKPSACYWMKSQTGGAAWMGKPSAGFLEFCCAFLNSGAPPWEPQALREKVRSYAESLERRRGCRILDDADSSL